MTDISVGDRVRVKYRMIDYKSDGHRNIRAQTDIGKVVAVPSEEFDWASNEFDFDYKVENGSSIRAVNFETNAVAQLIYNTGTSKDWERWDLVSVDVIPLAKM